MLKYSSEWAMPVSLLLLVFPTCATFADSVPGLGMEMGMSTAANKKEGIHIALYRIYKQQRKLDLAEKEVAAIAAISPNNSAVQQDWGRELIEAHKYSQAVPHFLRATKIDANNGDAWASLGDCYMQLTKYGTAVEAYKKAVQNERAGVDYRQRLQIGQQYVQHQIELDLYKKQLQKQKEESDE